MKTKQIIVTPGGKPSSIYIGVVLETDPYGDQGYFVYGFNANKPEPTDNKTGRLLIKVSFKSEEEALKAGEKIVKAKVKADFDKFKKANK